MSQGGDTVSQCQSAGPSLAPSVCRTQVLGRPSSQQYGGRTGGDNDDERGDETSQQKRGGRGSECVQQISAKRKESDFNVTARLVHEEVAGRRSQVAGRRSQAAGSNFSNQYLRILVYTLGCISPHPLPRRAASASIQDPFCSARNISQSSLGRTMAQGSSRRRDGGPMMEGGGNQEVHTSTHHFSLSKPSNRQRQGSLHFWRRIPAAIDNP